MRNAAIGDERGARDVELQDQLELRAKEEFGVGPAQFAQADLIARSAVGQVRCVHGELRIMRMNVIVDAQRKLVEEVLAAAAGEDNGVVGLDEVVAAEGL